MADIQMMFKKKMMCSERLASWRFSKPFFIQDISVLLPVPVYQSRYRFPAVNVHRHGTADLSAFHNPFTVEQIGDCPAVLVDLADHQA